MENGICILLGDIPSGGVLLYFTSFLVSLWFYFLLSSVHLSFIFLFLGCSPFSVSSCLVLVELVPFCFCFSTIWFGLDFSLLLLSIYHLVFDSSSSQSINYVFSSSFFSSSSVSPFYSLSHIPVPYFRSQTLSSHTHASGSIRKALWTQYVPDRLKKTLKKPSACLVSCRQVAFRNLKKKNKKKIKFHKLKCPVATSHSDGCDSSPFFTCFLYLRNISHIFFFFFYFLLFTCLCTFRSRSLHRQKFTLISSSSSNPHRHSDRFCLVFHTFTQSRTFTLPNFFVSHTFLTYTLA